MADNLKEKPGSRTESDESKENRAPSRDKPVQARETKEKASKVLRSESVEANEGQEDVENGDGRVSESVSEDKNRASVAGGKKAYTADEIEAIRAKLLAALPPQEVMIKQIRRKLYKEEKVLTKRMHKMQKSSHTNAFHLTIVVSQLRKVREYFYVLASATYEMVKHLWLKIVHGV
ncbi:hypothetical protein HZA42_02215 [Candidatus Peregrinibacteria bacterium]|nr:hypothetical protein [Candidatus Peregrinibacteria bacterium]